MLTTSPEVTLKITATCRRLQKSCRDWFTAEEPKNDQAKQGLPPFQTFHINYRFNGNTFQLDPATRDDELAYRACTGP
jgi:hypothetical protein